MSAEEYARIRRIFAFVMAIALWFVSNTFSVNGFNFQVANMIWAGWILSLTITALELVFTNSLATSTKNLSLYFFGLIAYAYGCISNFLGVWLLMGNKGLENVFDNGVTFLFVLVLSCMAEMVPEALLVFSLGVNSYGEGDAIRNFLDIKEKNKSNNNNNQGQNNNQQKQNKQNQPPQYPPMKPPSSQVNFQKQNQNQYDNNSRH